MRRIFSLLILFCLCGPAYPQTYEGKVIGVSDGDTITILIGGRTQLKVRLAEIDAPEKSQAFGQRSKQSLSDLVFGKQVKVEQQGPGPLRPGRRTDLCGRSGCQRQAGQAWHGVGLS
jgi:endonuclease YncB( thermonuclease family)